MFVFLFSFCLVSAQEANYTLELGEEAMNDIDSYVSGLEKDNLSNVYFKDKLIEAQVLFEGQNYEEIVKIQENLKERLKQAYDLHDNIFLLNKTITRYSKEGLVTNEILTKWNLANKAFIEERYEESKVLIEDVKIILEESRLEANILESLSENAKNFFIRNYLEIILVFAFLIIILVIILRTTYIVRLKKKIKKMRVEKKVIKKLIKQAQEDRFKKNLISGLIYNIRIKKYQEKASEIEQELPVLEGKFKKIKKKRPQQKKVKPKHKKKAPKRKVTKKKKVTKKVSPKPKKKKTKTIKKR